jgi:hypothetical protein
MVDPVLHQILNHLALLALLQNFIWFFWNDIKIPLVKCLNESLDNGKFSVSHR